MSCPPDTLQPARELLIQVADALRDIDPSGAIAIDGEWSTRKRRAYKQEEQFGTGTGPYVDVIDHEWTAHATAAFPIVGVAFALTNSEMYWAKSPPPATTIDMKVATAGYAHCLNDSFTVGLHLGGVGVPSLPVVTLDPREIVVVATGLHALGAPIQVCCAQNAEFFALFLPGPWVKVGRNRLWALRSGIAAGLPDPVRDLLTRGRTGRVPHRVMDADGPA